LKTLFIETVAAKPHLETAAEIIFRYKNNKKNIIKFIWLGDNLLWNDWKLSKVKILFGFSYKKRINSFINFLIKNKIKCENINDNNLIDDYKNIIIWAKNFRGNLQELRKYHYKGFSIGEGVATSIISYFRNENLELAKIQKFVENLLISAAIVLERTDSLIKKEKPNKIITFNGRFSICYPIVLAARKNNVKILFHDRGSDYNKFEIFKKNIHDHSFRAQEILRYWRLNKNVKKKYYIAKKYFLKRINREPIGVDVGFSFVKNQKKNYLNLNNIEKKRIVVFYTATDYEQAADIFDYEQENIFKKFLSVLKNFKDIHLIVRVHPGINVKNSVEDKKWNKYSSKDVTVINSDDRTDSYKLMKISDIVVTYSSRIIIEAAYWGKKTISLNNERFYSRFGIGFYSSSANVLRRVLKSGYRFKKIDKKKCLYIGYYFQTFGIKYRYYKPKDYFNGTFYKMTFDWKPKIIIFFEKIKLNLFYRLIKDKILYNFIYSNISR